MAKRVTKAYRKAFSFASCKYDIEKRETGEAGKLIDDIIEFVCKKMYRASLTIDQDNEDVEGQIKQESEFIKEDNENTNIEKDVTTGNVEVGSSKATVAPAEDDDIEDDDDINVPINISSPSFMAFVLWVHLLSLKKG